MTLSLRSLRFFRVALGALLLLDLALRLTDYPALYSASGIIPDALVPWSLHRGWWQPLVWIVHGLAAVSLVVGYRPRIAAGICWALLLSLHLRNQFATNGGDNILRLLLLWSALLPLDRSRGTYRSPLALMFLLQLAAVYWGSVSAKTDPVWWRDFSAVYYALNLDYHTAPLGTLLRQCYGMTQGLTVGTLLLEAIGPALVLIPRTRKIGIVLLVGFHLGLALTMRLGLFPYVCIVGWLACWPSDDPVEPVRDTVSQWVALLVLGGAVWGIVGSPPRVLLGLGIANRFTMFAPHPGNDDGWFVMDGQRTGKTVRVWGSEGKPTWTHAWRNIPWFGVLRAVRQQPAFRPYLAGYLCRLHGLDSLTMGFQTEPTPLSGQLAEPGNRQVLWSGACSGI